MPNYLSPGVYVEEVESGSRPIEGVGTAVAAFVGFAGRGPANTPTLVTNWTQFTSTFGEFLEGSYLAHAVYGYFLNGGGAAYVVRVGADGVVPTATAEVASSDKAKPAFQVAALEAGPAGNDITVDVAAGGRRELVQARRQAGRQGGRDVRQRHDREGQAQRRHDGQGGVEADHDRGGRARSLPPPDRTALAGGSAAVPSRVTPDDYVGNSADRTGFAGLEAVDEVTMLSVPDLMAVYEQGMIDLEGVQAVQLAMIAHCELMGDRVAILDAPPGLNAQQVKEWRVDKAGYDSQVRDALLAVGQGHRPAVAARRCSCRRAGHVAGIWARNDDTRGVHKAPANEVIRGAISLELNITKGEHDQLNPDGINCIRSFPGRGIRVWGARTLSSDPEWRYLNVRRLFNYVEESIFEGTHWVVFEPNDQQLWDRVKRTINAFLLRVWRDGALFGATPDQAFFVKCDEENNPPENRDAGQLIVEIGIAPVKPAEFVVFRIAQFSGAPDAE